MDARRIVLSLFLLVAAFAGRSQQFPSDFWHQGKAVLDNGDTLKGLVKYDFQKDLIQLREAEHQAEVYTARKLLFVEIFDESVKRYRQFYALPYSVTGTYKAPVFFELLKEGKITLLSREHLETKTYTSMYYMGAYSRVVLVNKYFFLKENGDIVEFTGTKNDLLDMMGKKGDAVQDYIKENHLKFDDKYDLARIVEYYNSLSGS
jgi:hypothetical protein